MAFYANLKCASLKVSYIIYSCFIDEECPKISLAEMLDDLDIGQEDATGEEGGEMLE